MSYGIPSDEVAEDYRKALEDLTMNTRYEISNLTVIAKENTEHALAISEALKSHIKRTTPQKKLPAFYVLDSVVKNVGTPYTLFFGRQLYSTFMEAYALVDNNVRRKMDEMLKTWKEPVPGSIDSRPVFPPEVTRPIENALIVSRTNAVEAHQKHLQSQQQALGRGRPSPSPAPYRGTATPPTTYGQYQPPPQRSNPVYPTAYPPQQNYVPPVNGQTQYQAQPINMYQQSQQPQTHNPPPQYQQPQMNGSSWQQPLQQAYQGGGISVENLNRDIANLIDVSKADFGVTPWDSNIQVRLKALLDLQTVLRTQQMPQEQLALIQNQVNQLSQASHASRTNVPVAAPVPTPVATPVVPVSAPNIPPSIGSLLGSGALAALLARQSATPQPASQAPNVPVRSPQTTHQVPYQAPPTVTAAPTPASDPSALLERLRAAGILGGATVTKSPALANVQLPTLPPGFPPPPPLTSVPNLGRPALNEIPNDAVLKPASLKIPRPHLISALYEKLGTPCNQCGRRFKSDTEGKEKKAAHLDWHFKVNQRMSEAEKRGQHRSWYVDELEWIRSRETDPESATTITETSSNSTTTVINPKHQYIPVPDDPIKASSVCPVCQEKFELKWLDEAQEFVWMDARDVGGRIYHASCYAEATKDVGAAKIKESTPDGSVLGKRKAEDEHVLRPKIKREPSP